MRRGLTVSRRDLERVVGTRPFVALPAEETARLHGAIETQVVGVPSRDASRDPSLDKAPDRVWLGAIGLLHRNYVWQTFARDLTAARASIDLGLRAPCRPEHAEIFLDDGASDAAHALLTPLGAREAYDLRLAGLLMGAALEPSEPWMYLVHVARLRRDLAHPGAIALPLGERLGSVELVQRRDTLDPLSRVLVDHLAAL
jgi:hypothetical protein